MRCLINVNNAENLHLPILTKLNLTRVRNELNAPLKYRIIAFHLAKQIIHYVQRRAHKIIYVSHYHTHTHTMSYKVWHTHNTQFAHTFAITWRNTRVSD